MQDSGGGDCTTDNSVSTIDIPAAPTAAPSAIFVANVPPVPFASSNSPPPIAPVHFPPTTTVATPGYIPTNRIVSNTDPRLKDAIELSLFAVAALKVRGIFSDAS